MVGNTAVVVAVGHNMAVEPPRAEPLASQVEVVMVVVASSSSSSSAFSPCGGLLPASVPA